MQMRQLDGDLDSLYAGVAVKEPETRRLVSESQSVSYENSGFLHCRTGVLTCPGRTDLEPPTPEL